MQAKIEHDVLPEEVFKEYQKQILSLDVNELSYGRGLQRYTLTALTGYRDGLIKNKDGVVESLYFPEELENDFTGPDAPEKSEQYKNAVLATYNIHKDLIDFARKTFNSETLQPTYAIVCYYKDRGSLEMHRDFYCNRYVVDYCLYQKHPWDFYVEDEKFSMVENDTVSFYGLDQVHGRKDYPHPEDNSVINVMFVFAEPEDWYFNNAIQNHQSILKHLKSNYKL